MLIVHVRMEPATFRLLDPKPELYHPHNTNYGCFEHESCNHLIWIVFIYVRPHCIHQLDWVVDEIAADHKGRTC